MADADVTADAETDRRALLMQRLAGAEALGHEVLNPLNCALLQLAVLQRRLEEPDCLPVALRPVAETVERALRRLAVLCNDLVSLPPYRGAETNLLEDATAETRRWIGAVMAEGGTADVETSLTMMGAGLRALRARLTVEEAAQLGGYLPVVVRGMFFEAWDPGARGAQTAAQLLTILGQRFPAPEGIADAVADVASVLLRVLRRQMDGTPAPPAGA